MRSRVSFDPAALARAAAEARRDLIRERLEKSEAGRRRLYHPEERKERGRHDPG